MSGAPLKKRHVRHFRHLVRQFQRVTGVLLQGEDCCGGVTMPQGHVLLEISQRSGIALGDLAGGLRLDKSTLSRTVEALVDRGLVERKPNPADRRSNLHLLTPSGEQVIAEIHRTSDECVRATFTRIPAAERQRVLDSLQILVTAMGAAEGCCDEAPPEERSAA